MTLFAEADEQLAAAGTHGPDLVACPVGVGALAHAMVAHHPGRGERGGVRDRGRVPPGRG